MKRLVSIALLLISATIWTGCNKNEETTTIYGTVFDKKTHEPVAGAQVEIGGTNTGISDYDDFLSHTFSYYRYSSCVSGTDGLYELKFNRKAIREDYIYISVDCYGYNKYFSCIVVKDGDISQMDINL